ncbi:hypothetical protein CCH79_00006050 [Gambusia affinis]|uniref:Uncharacterized protein n=1 Tax=Gambusia affinis TaxID=33528 RepID=A0A315VIZ4_GAMAF|nr:hypothetical protein CCH79_00006050 [Gambusia affinis]
MLSLVITLFSMASEPSELAMASWLNSTVCFCTALNLEVWTLLAANTDDTPAGAVTTRCGIAHKTAHPSTCLRSDSDIVLARDFGLKNPSYPCSFNSGKKKLKKRNHNLGNMTFCSNNSSAQVTDMLYCLRRWLGGVHPSRHREQEERCIKVHYMSPTALLAGRVRSGSWSEIHDLAGGCSVGTVQKKKNRRRYLPLISSSAQYDFFPFAASSLDIIVYIRLGSGGISINLSGNLDQTTKRHVAEDHMEELMGKLGGVQSRRTVNLQGQRQHPLENGHYSAGDKVQPEHNPHKQIISLQAEMIGTVWVKQDTTKKHYIDLTDPRWACPELKLRPKFNIPGSPVIDLTASETKETKPETKNSLALTETRVTKPDIKGCFEIESTVPKCLPIMLKSTTKEHGTTQEYTSNLLQDQATQDLQIPTDCPNAGHDDANLKQHKTIENKLDGFHSSDMIPSSTSYQDKTQKEAICSNLEKLDLDHSESGQRSSSDHPSSHSSQSSKADSVSYPGSSPLSHTNQGGQSPRSPYTPSEKLREWELESQTYEKDTGGHSPMSLPWQGESDREDMNEESRCCTDFREASREDRRHVCPITLKKLMAGHHQVLLTRGMLTFTASTSTRTSDSGGGGSDLRLTRSRRSTRAGGPPLTQASPCHADPRCPTLNMIYSTPLLSPLLEVRAAQKGLAEDLPKKPRQMVRDQLSTPNRVYLNGRACQIGRQERLTVDQSPVTHSTICDLRGNVEYDGMVLAVMSPHSCENIHSTRSVARQLLSKEKQKQPSLRRAM